MCMFHLMSLRDGGVPPPDHQYMHCHMILDDKMEDFCPKAQLVAARHMTKAPASPTYASVMSQEIMCIALLVVCEWATDVLNVYSTVPCHKNIWTTLGQEFGDDCGPKAMISSGTAFRVHLVRCLCKIGYRSCLADPDLWLKEQTDRKGSRYYAYILCYLDNFLVVHHNPGHIVDRLTAFFSSSLTQLVPLRCILEQRR
ncbi:hypothetical protein ACHAW6_002394 [Cyclotella cf. meneghiniana]